MIETEKMTISRAIRIAQGRVSIVPQGHQYVVRTWSPKHDATWQSDLMDRDRAHAYAWEQRVHLALDLVGCEDAQALAASAAEKAAGDPKRPDWRSIARDIAIRGKGAI